MIRQKTSDREPWTCFDGEKLFNISRMRCRLSIPRHNLAPGMYGMNGNLFKDGQFIFSFGMEEINILDEKTLFLTSTSFIGMDSLRIYDIETDKIVSCWHAIDDHFITILGYISANDRTKVLVFFTNPKKWIVVDISQPDGSEVTDKYSLETELKIRQVQLLYYDKVTGFPVMFCKYGDIFLYALLVFNGKCFSSLKLDENPEFLGEYVIMGTKIYKVNIGVDGELKLSFISDRSNPSTVLANARDLAGMVYVTKSGIFRESITFTNTKSLSRGGIEPVNDIFWLGNDLVLLSGAMGSVTVSLNPGSVVHSWYKSESTKFASELFQVCGTKVYTEQSSTDLSFPEAFMFAQFGDNLVVATPSKIAIISRTLEILRTFETTCVSLFSEGYVSATGVVFFQKPELNVTAKGIVQACMLGGELFTLSRDGQIRIGSNMVELDLPLEHVSSIYSFGDTVVICDQSDTYIYNQGNYSSLAAGADEVFVLSNDHRKGVFLKNGVASLKTNAVFQMTRKPVAGEGPYDDISVYKDMLMCRVKPDMGEKDFLIVKYISGKIIKQFKGPDEPQMYQLISDEHFVSSPANGDGFMRLYNLNDTGKIVFENSWQYDEIYDNSLYTLPEQRPWICFSYHGGGFTTRGTLALEDGELEESIEEEVESMPTDEGAQRYALGMRPCNYIRNGYHWLYWTYAEDRYGLNTRVVKLLPKSQEYVDIPKSQESICAPQYDNCMSGVRLQVDPDVYYVATVSGTQYVILKMTSAGTSAFISNGYISSESVRYTRLPKKVKYDPDFIISDGDFATVTILPEDEAERLRKLQKELISGKDKTVAGDIDGRFLLAATMDSENDLVFMKHGVDRNKLNKDLWDIFK